MKKNRKEYLTAILSVLIIACLAGLGYVIFFHQEESPDVLRPSEPERHATSAKKVKKEKPPTAAPENQASRENQKEKKVPPPPLLPLPEKEKVVVAKIVPPAVSIRQAAIIIDDIGGDMKPVRELLRIDADITFAILPRLAHSREAAEVLHQANRETLLHLPMEPLTYPKDRPGEGALFTEMNEEEISAQINKNLLSVPYVSGVNNHMGSKFMSDEDKLLLVFRELKKKNLFFIDSRTTPSSKSREAARRSDLTIASRRVFLDNERDYDKIYAILMEVANAPSGGAPLIVIGHPYPETIRAIRDANKIFQQKGLAIIPVSKLLKKKAQTETS